VKRRTLAALAIAAITWLALAAVAEARVWNVHPGESIQRHINMASPGDTIKVHPGHYRENLTIMKNGITLIGLKDDDEMVVLSPRAMPRPSPCNFGPDAINGICILGEIDLNTGEPGEPIRHVTVRGFKVRDFSSFGVLLLNAWHTRISHTTAIRNAGYGISGFVLHHVTYTHNVSAFNGEPGFYIGDSPDAQAVVKHNTAWANGSFGFFFRDASMGMAEENRSSRNCVGMLFLNTEAHGPVRNWVAEENRVWKNNGTCEGGEGEPPLSGLGIALAGTNHVVVEENVIKRNRPSGESLVSGGVVVVSESAERAPRNNVVRDNLLRGNEPDIFWDETGSGNVFEDNDCVTSLPPGLCGG
jgi:hypothetical protein